MRKANIEYDDFLNGRYKRGRRVVTFGGFLSGARYTTNDFGDRSLKITENAFHNLLEIVRSGRRQEFEIIKIHFKDIPSEHIGLDAMDIMALERVVIDSFFSEAQRSLTVYYPDMIWKELTFWNAKRTQSVTSSDLDRLTSIFAVREMEQDDQKFVMKMLKVGRFDKNTLPDD